jgi:hypothetical protein
MLTLYADDGNQPRLRARGKALQGDRFVFEFVDATNLKSGDLHAVGLEMLFMPDNSFEQRWRFQGAKGQESLPILFRKRR